MLTVEPVLVERYVRPGKVKLVFRDVLDLGDKSVRLSEAAACAGKQGHFWEMHELFYARQDDSYAAAGDKMVEYAAGVAAQVPGLEGAALQKCMNDRLPLAGLQAAYQEQRARGVTQRPAFEINGRRLLGLQSVEVMSAAIEEALKK